MMRASVVIGVAISGGCALHVHLEVGVRHDGSSAAVHGAVALAIGDDSRQAVPNFYGGSIGGGVDFDTKYGATGTVNAAYFGSRPGPLLHSGRFTAIGGTAVKLGGGLALPIWQHERETGCFICTADREQTYTTDIGAVGLNASVMADTNGPSIAGDLVLDLIY
jgi:hypothetical protein